MLLHVGERAQPNSAHAHLKPLVSNETLHDHFIRQPIRDTRYKLIH